MKLVKQILKSPLLQFSLLGIVLFFGYRQIIPESKETIIIEPQTIKILVDRQENLRQSKLSTEEQQSLIENYIKEEILLREAYRNGFYKNDPRVRKRLLNVMRTSLTDVYPDPTNAQLLVFYDQNKDKYKSDSSISIQHIFFAVTSKNHPEDSAAFIDQLENSSNPLKFSDFSSLGNTLTKLSFRQLSMYFGKPFAASIIELEPGKWTGPYTSNTGSHYVYVLQRHYPETPSFESMESYLKQEYLMQKMRESQDMKIAEMQKRYNVIVEE